MCGRYAFFDEQEVYEARKILEDIAASFGKETADQIKTGEIFPTEKAATVCQNEDSPIAKPLGWGFLLPGNKAPIINARIESLFEKPFFLRNIAHKKCLIPANAFYEWERQGTIKIKHSIRLQCEPFFYMCGLYAPFIVNGQTQERFVIITQPANAQMRLIHERMPLILPMGLKDAWLHETKNVKLLTEKIAQSDTLLDIA